MCGIHARDEHVDDVSRHIYIDFLLVMISVGLASARPNKHEHSLSSTKCSIEFAEVKNDENELEVWHPWMFFGGTD